jgi:hypothetical protein
MHCAWCDMLPRVDRSSHNIFLDPLPLEYGALLSLEKPVSEYQLEQRLIPKERKSVRLNVGNSKTET